MDSGWVNIMKIIDAVKFKVNRVIIISRSSLIKILILEINDK